MNHNLIQGVADKSDCLISSPNKLKQTLSMGVIKTQEHVSTNISGAGHYYIHRKWKQNLQPHQFPEAKNYRYKGSAKPPMPKSDSKFQIWPLKVLENAQVSFNRAKGKNFHFMQLIANDFEEPVYNGYNTKIDRETGQKLQARTYIKYFSVINMNPAERDTTLTTMHDKDSNWKLWSNVHRFYKWPAVVQCNNTDNMVAAKRTGKLLFSFRGNVSSNNICWSHGKSNEYTGLLNILKSACWQNAPG